MQVLIFPSKLHYPPTKLLPPPPQQNKIFSAHPAKTSLKFLTPQRLEGGACHEIYDWKDCYLPLYSVLMKTISVIPCFTSLKCIHHQSNFLVSSSQHLSVTLYDDQGFLTREIKFCYTWTFSKNEFKIYGWVTYIAYQSLIFR